MDEFENLVGKIDIRKPYSDQNVVLSPGILDMIKSFKISVSKRLGKKFDTLPDDWLHDPKTLTWLCRHRGSDFPFWFNDDIKNYLDEFSWEFSFLPPWTFKYWWDPDKFVWKSISSWNLATKHRAHFDIWWDPDKFDWEYSSYALISSNSKIWQKWWDSDKLYFDKYSYQATHSLIRSKIPIELWWDRVPRTEWNNKSISLSLLSFRSGDFDTWWGTFPFKYGKYVNQELCRHCSEYFDKWYDPKIFDTPAWWNNNTTFLPIHCSNHFLKWFSPKIFSKFKLPSDLNRFETALITHCSDYFVEW